MTSQAAPHLITIGETMMMVAPARAESLSIASDVRLHAGGAESNVACHVAHLGIATAWVSALGDDVLGHRIHGAIAEHGVDTRWVAFDPMSPTGVYFKDPGNGVLYYRRGSAASMMNPGSLDGIPLEEADIVHVTGITPALSADCAALIDAVFDRVTAAAGTTLSFDVNYRPALWSPDAAAPLLHELASRADLVFVGRDEAETLWGCRTAADVRALLPNPWRLVVKDGDVGATEFATEDTTEATVDVSAFEPAIPTEVLEAVGAGDAFAAGYLAALLRGEPTRDRLRAGHERASLVLQSTSDFIVEATAVAAAGVAGAPLSSTEATIEPTE